MYEAKIIESNLSNGLLSAVVEFKDSEGNDVFTERFETTRPQTQDWLNQQITAKIETVTALDAIRKSIKIGDRIIYVERAETETPERIEFKNDLDAFHRLVSAAQQGIVDRNSQEFIGLRDKLKNNFIPEYLDLF